MSNLKVLAIIDAIELTGPGKGLLQLAGAVKGLNVEIVIATLCYPGRRSRFSEAVVDRGVECVPLYPQSRLDPALLRQLSAIILDRKINVIQSHSFKPHIYAAAVGWKTGRPWIAFAHGWTTEIWRTHISNFLERQLLRRADHVVVLSTALEKDLRRSGRRGPISIVMNAIEPLEPKIGSNTGTNARLKLGIDGMSYVILCIGRLSREKGQDILMASLQRMRPALNRPIVLLLAGDGPERGRLGTLAESLKGRVDVRFLGHVPNVDPLYEAADIVVMPSRSEGTPNVILEAMRYGRPIVATRVGSVPSMLLDGQQAILVDPGDTESLATSIQSLYEDSRRSSALGSAARAALWPKFSVETRARRMAEVYHQVSER